jgi:hypothetical protein
VLGFSIKVLLREVFPNYYIMSKRAVEEQGNNKKDIVKSHGSSKPTAYAGPDQIVYEGSEVKLDGSNSFAQNNTSNNNRLSSYYWRQVAGPKVDLDKNNNIVSPSFKAPYVDVDFNTAGSKILTLLYHLN